MTKNSMHLLLLTICIMVAIIFPPILFIIAPIWIGVAYIEDKRNTVKN